MRFLIIAALLTLSACTTGPVTPGSITLNAEKGLLAGRGTHYLVCSAVETSHASGLLTGSKFNTAKRACIEADDALDVGDAALIMGDTVTAAARVSAALAKLDQAKALTPQ